MTPAVTRLSGMDEAFETFLTLCAHPDIGSAAGDSRPVIVISTAHQKVIWTNAAGAELCGVATARDLAEAPSQRAQTLARDLSRQLRFDETLSPRSALVRLRRGLTPVVLNCDILPIATGEKSPLARVLVVAPPSATRSGSNPWAAFARFAGGPAATIVNASGATVARAADEEPPENRARPVPIGATGLMLHLPAAARGGAEAPTGSWGEDETTFPAADLGAKAVRAEPPAPRAIETPRSVRPVRFTWQTDSDNQLTFLSPEFATTLRPTEPVVGRTWAELSAALDLDPDGAVAAAVAERAAWSGTTVFWPSPAYGGRVPVDLAGLAIQDRDRAFKGFRGFGLIRPGDVVADATLAPSIADQPVPDDREAADEVEPVVTREPERPAPEPRPEQKPYIGTPDPSNVVRLRRHEPAPAEDISHLSRPEREAFRLIAAALGARFEGDEIAPLSLSPDDLSAPLAEPPATAEAPDIIAHHEPMPSAFATVARTPDTRVLDRLPLALIVSQRERLIHVNTAALSLLNYPDGTSLERAGGLGAVFADVAAPPDAADNAILLRQADGTLIAAEVRLHTVPWGEERALLVILRALPAGDSGEEEEMSQEHDDGPSEPADAPLARMSPAKDAAPAVTGLLDAIPDAVFVLDPPGTIALANAGAAAIFRRPVEAFAGMRLDDLLDEDGGAVVHDLLDEIASGEDGGRPLIADEVNGLCRERGNVPLALSIGRIGNGPRFCAVLRDVARFKSAEARYSEATRAAETANAQKSEMLARISHEIRTPLNAILGFADVMLAEKLGPLGNQRYRDYLRDISISGHHILSLVNDLLDLSKIEAGKLDLSFEPVSVNDIARDCTNLMEPQAQSDRVEIRTRLQGDLPRILADTRSLRQITLNLLSNAIKFNRSGGVVSLSTFRDETGAVVLRVSDNGVGMSEDDLKAALEPFLRVGGSDKAGTGLGLPLTKALAEANRADFKIRSEPARGTVVDITFPAPRVLAA